jgi:hypothetical protein
MNHPSHPTVGTILRYWCRNCDRSFQAAETAKNLPPCTKGEGHELVPIYVEYNPEDDELRTDADFGEGD